MFSFRIRLLLPLKNWFVEPGESVELDLTDNRFPEVTFAFSNPSNAERPSAATSIVFEGAGYPTAEDAADGGARMRACLMAALARSHMGADFGDRRPTGGLTTYARRLAEAKVGRPVLNESRGDVLVFESHPKPIFVEVGPATGSRGPKRGFHDDLQMFADLAAARMDQVESAFDSYSASFFSTNPDVRLVLLVTAVEYLIYREPRGDIEVEFIRGAIERARGLEIDKKARDRLISGLRELKMESISQAGQRLIDELMQNDLQFGGTDAQDLFKKAYVVRSKIVHGDTPRPTRDEVGGLAARVEIMVGDLIAEACAAAWKP